LDFFFLLFEKQIKIRKKNPETYDEKKKGGKGGEAILEVSWQMLIDVLRRMGHRLETASGRY